jgi:basic membrane protein A
MRKKFMFLVVVLILASLVLVACAPTAEESPGKVLFEINGFLDEYYSFAADGVKKASEEYGFEVVINETGEETGRVNEDLTFAADSGDYDLIIGGTWNMVDPVLEAAEAYPDQTFIFFDETIDGVPNIAAFNFDNYEGAFLVGALAGLVTTSNEMPNANADKVVGWIGGMEDPTVNLYRDGFSEGAKYVDPDIEVLDVYVGSWGDPAKAKELAASMIQEGADVIFTVSGGGDLGIYEEIQDKNIYGIAIDQNLNPTYPGYAISALLKDTGAGLYSMIQLYYDGTLPVGETTIFGLDSDGMGLAMDEYYEEYVSASIREELTEIEQGVIDGSIDTNVDAYK